MNSGGFSRVFLFAVYAPRSVGVTTNELVIEQTQTAPERIFGLASLSVEQWEEEESAQLQSSQRLLSTPP